MIIITLPCIVSIDSEQNKIVTALIRREIGESEKEYSVKSKIFS